MNRWKSTWSPLLLGMLLMAVLVGVAGDGRSVGAAGSRQLIVPAAHFHQTDNLDTTRYTNFGDYVISGTSVTPVKLCAPVQFPVAYYATVEKVELMAYDNNPSGEIAVMLVKTKPATGYRSVMAFISTGEAFTSTTDPLIWGVNIIDTPTVKPAEGAFLKLEFRGMTALDLYGVRIWYHPGF